MGENIFGCGRRRLDIIGRECINYQLKTFPAFYIAVILPGIGLCYTFRYQKQLWIIENDSYFFNELFSYIPIISPYGGKQNGQQ